MASNTLTVSGLDTLKRALEIAPDRANQRAAQAVASSTYSTENRVRVGAPEDTGLLKRSIDSNASRLTGRVTIDNAAYYWRFIEHGYTKSVSASGGRFQVPARPFVRAAAEAETPVFVRKIEEVARSIERDFSTSRFL